MASTEADEVSQTRRVRGITKGKSTQRIVKRTEKKISVKVDVEFNALVGESASQVAHALGIQVRKNAPVEGISKWSDIDATIKDSIVQGVLDWFDIEGYGSKEKVTKIINAKCQDLYRWWKGRAKRYYVKLLGEGKDPYANCFPSMEDAKWRYMIENVWITERFQKRSEINQENRNKMTYNHTMGSKSFASSLYEFTAEANKNQEKPKFSEFFKLSHRSEKKKDWIDQRCEEDYVALKQLEDESLTNGEEIISPAEMSQKVFGKKNYLKGLGPNMKVKKKIMGEPNRIHSDELQALNTEVETFRSVHQEYEDKLVLQDAMIKSQEEKIESQNKKIEELGNKYTRFVNLILNGGSLSDVNLSQNNNLN